MTDTVTWQEVANSDPERPADGHYYDLNNVPWYARMPFTDRILYLDWIIAKRRGQEDRSWRGECAKTHPFLAQFAWGKTTARLRELELHRRVELADREPLSDWHLSDYRRFLDTWRWKRTRQRKLISVQWRCEYPGCTKHAEECHHLHYETVGLESNADLEALCRGHHRARHHLT